MPLLALLMCTAGNPGAQEPADGRALVEAAVTYYRGEASVAKVQMMVHRSGWEREMTIKAWTLGKKFSLFYITDPPKDEGNGTLKRGTDMWTYNPKVNRVIKLPPSMMSQAWMGSDFSNNDLAKSDSIIDDYVHTVEGEKTVEGKKVFIVRSMPKPEAPVIWGMQKLYIREDDILLREEFYDEDKLLVKTMTGEQIEMLGGKLFPKVWRMKKADAKDEYTLLRYLELEFKENLPQERFTVSALRHPGRM
ncbi:MAG: outer membrane lipoprotein-sorting protein [Desulfobacteraceae bacterium]|nr:outer membrane lipoprotein-sorting protein [Desulfobacteraceae bacterium]